MVRTANEAVPTITSSFDRGAYELNSSGTLYSYWKLTPGADVTRTLPLFPAGLTKARANEDWSG